jgi:hypothetical protein
MKARFWRGNVLVDLPEQGFGIPVAALPVMTPARQEANARDGL